MLQRKSIEAHAFSREETRRRRKQCEVGDDHYFNEGDKVGCYKGYSRLCIDGDWEKIAPCNATQCTGEDATTKYANGQYFSCWQKTNHSYLCSDGNYTDL